MQYSVCIIRCLHIVESAADTPAGGMVYPADRHGVILPLKICVGVTSGLSIIGGFLIVLTFCLRLYGRPRTPPPSNGPAPAAALPARRTMSKMEMMGPGRLILVNLSIADILLAGSHLWGVAAGYEHYFRTKNDNALNSGPNGSTDVMCDVQGALAVYGTISSFLWTIILSFFVVGTLLLPHPRRYGSMCAMLLYLVTCWGIPALVVLVITLEKEFGLEDDVTIAWCYVLPRSQSQSVIINLFAYNLWSYLSILLLVLFFLVTVTYACALPSPRNQRDVIAEDTPLVNQRIRRSRRQEMKSDYFKLILAALILVVLRIWDAIYVSIGYHPHYDRSVADSNWILVLIFLAGIGNSAQGAANAVLFLLCTKTYRKWIIQSITSCYRRSSAAELT